MRRRAAGHAGRQAVWVLGGALGAGLVWGWLLASLTSAQRTTIADVAVTAISAIFIAEMLIFGGGAAAVAFLIATGAGFVAHLTACQASREAIEGVLP